MIQFHDVEKKFKKRVLFYNVNFQLPNHGLVGLFGRSGSGKTTILKMIKNFEKTTRGTIEIDVDQSEIIFLNQSLESFDHISLEFYFKILNLSDKLEEIKVLFEKCHLPFVLDQKINTLSNGEKKRLQLITAIAMEAKVLLMDEPFSGLDEESIRLIIPLIVDYAKRALVIVSTHQEKETIPFDIVLNLFKKQVTFERINEITEIQNTKKEKKKSSLFSFYQYLFQKSFNILNLLWMILLGVVYCIGFFGVSTSSFDYYDMAKKYYKDHPSILPVVDRTELGYNVLPYHDIRFSSIPLLSAFSYENEENENEIDAIGIYTEGLADDEIVLSKNIYDELSNLNTYTFEGKEYKIKDTIEFYDIRIVCFSKNYPLDIQEVIVDFRTNENGEPRYYEVKVREDLESNEVVYPRNLYRLGEFYNINNGLKLRNSSIYKADAIVEENEEDVIYVSQEKLKDWYFVFDSLGHYYMNTKNISSFIDEAKELSYGFYEEGFVKMYNDLRLNYGTNSALTYACFVTYFLITALLQILRVRSIDVCIYERELNFLALRDERKRILIFHMLLHVFYIIISIGISVLLRNSILIFRKTSTVMNRFYYLSSPKAIGTMLLFSIAFSLLSFAFMLLSRRKGYSYVNELKKTDY